jgi:hypothetical protein
MPSTIGAKSAGSARLTRQAAAAGPVWQRPDAVLAPPQPSMVTITEATVPLSTPMVETGTFPDAMCSEVLTPLVSLWDPRQTHPIWPISPLRHPFE